jgi:nucleotide-binding universal stress UspA family protein
MSLIVVGVDGSEESKEALRWAIDEAHLRKATVRAIHVWTYPLIFAGEFVPPDMVDANSLRDAAQKALDETVAEVAGDNPDAYIERIVEHGSVAHVLVDAAKEANLLVVGSRGHGGFTGSLLGSVSQQCAHHAPCAVVIVRKQRQETVA